MSEDKRIRYSRLNDRFPKNTLVTFRNDDLVYFGISRCNSKRDHFSKEFGKQLAEQRALLASAEVSMGENETGGMEIHKSGLRGVTKVEDIKRLLTYFQNIDDIMLAQENKESMIESIG